MRVPASTYRLQITADFTLADAAATLPYLHDLGVDWVYLSPILRAEPGSTHGYDVVDHTTVDPARGGEEGLASVSAEARRLGMACWSTSCPTTWAWPPRPRTPGGGICSAAAATRRTPMPSTSTGEPAVVGSCSRSSATTTPGRSGSTPVPVSSATTTTPSPSRR